MCGMLSTLAGGDIWKPLSAESAFQEYFFVDLSVGRGSVQYVRNMCCLLIVEDLTM